MLKQNEEVRSKSLPAIEPLMAPHLQKVPTFLMRHRLSVRQYVRPSRLLKTQDDASSCPDGFVVVITYEKNKKGQR